MLAPRQRSSKRPVRSSERERGKQFREAETRPSLISGEKVPRGRYMVASRIQNSGVRSTIPVFGLSWVTIVYSGAVPSATPDFPILKILNSPEFCPFEFQIDHAYRTGYRVVVEQSITYGRLGSLNCAFTCVEICSQVAGERTKKNQFPINNVPIGREWN